MVSEPTALPRGEGKLKLRLELETAVPLEVRWELKRTGPES